MQPQGLQIQVSGKVQGVSFRSYCQKEAQKLGLTGSVENLNNGKVKIYAWGRPEALEALLTWSCQGSPWAKVEEVIPIPWSPSPAPSRFTIR